MRLVDRKRSRASTAKGSHVRANAESRADSCRQRADVGARRAFDLQGRGRLIAGRKSSQLQLENVYLTRRSLNLDPLPRQLIQSLSLVVQRRDHGWSLEDSTSESRQDH